MDLETLAATFSEAFPVGDFDTLRKVFHPDAVVWHNYDGIEQPLEENLAMLARILRAHTLRYVDIRRWYCEQVVVQQHRVLIDERGEPTEVEACLVLHVRNGRIARLDEYVDPNRLAVLSAEMMT